MNHLKSSLFLLIFMLCILPGGNAQSPFPKNDDLLAQAVDDGLTMVLMDSSLTIDVPVIVEQGMSALHRFLSERCMLLLYQAGFDVYTDTDSVQYGILFSLNPVNMHIRYDNNRTSGYKKDTIHRSVYAEFNIKIIDRVSGKIHHIADVVHTKDDWIPAALLDYAEFGSVLPEPARPPDPAIKRWVEPLLVIGAAGAISILFYTIRSQ